LVSDQQELGNMKNSNTYGLIVGVNVFIFLLKPLVRSEGVQVFLKAFIKGVV
jgi:hypothetical protein